MRLAVGCDHRGLDLKAAAVGLIERMGHTYHDFGCYSPDSVDYPDIALDVARGVAGGQFDRGILVCSTGIGMCITANKVKGVRAAVCADALAAQRCREHNDCNVLCLGQDMLAGPAALKLVGLFLTTAFEGGRHQSRLDKIRAVEEGC
ncbi:MAG: ribose 5-phosphate isomerase B [Dehalococcoidia bacterium]|nr:ribose 5-phosphate isomerase B [Dehalococcoidia bacterium]MDP7240039.1 ribose 5-phosphate isomerase B [Dehalococcoidia bacterium]